MQPEHTNSEVEEENQLNKPNSLHQVTPLSKYFAMALFIILPFVGGWIGYEYAPEKVVEKEVVREIEVGNGTEQDGALQENSNVTADNKIPYRQFVEVDASGYPNVNNQYFIDNPSESLRLVSDDTGVIEALRLSDTMLLLFAASSYNMHIAFLLYDEMRQEIVEEVPFPLLSLYTWYDDSTLVYVGGQANKIVIIDYLNNKTEVLYEEDDSSVQLVEVSEIGQVGDLGFEQNEVVFSRYRKQDGTTLAKFIEQVRVAIPEEFLE